MKEYCINDFVRNNRELSNYINKGNFSPYYIQIQDSIGDCVMEEGEELCKILIFKDQGDKSCIDEIGILAPMDGYYFIEPYYIINRIPNLEAKTNVIKCYEDLGEDVADGKEHFVDSYNELLTAIRDYYEDFITNLETKNKYSYLGECDYSIGIPETDKPKDFLSILDSILQRRSFRSTKESIRDCDTLTRIVESADYYTTTMVYITSKCIIIDNKLVRFEEICELSNDGNVLNQKHEYVAHAGSNILIRIIENIIDAKPTGDYSSICSNELLSKYKDSYSILDLINDKSGGIINKNSKYKFKIANEYDMAFPEDAVDYNNRNTHYYTSNDLILELTDENNSKIQVRSKEHGYYSFSVPSFWNPLFFDLPFFEYTSPKQYYETYKSAFNFPNEYTIEQDRFTKEKTIVWNNRDNFQILPDSWYEFRISFKYIKNRPSIIVYFKNAYSKRVLREYHNYINGQDFRFYLLLVNGESYEYNNKKYQATWIGEKGGYIGVEYSLGVQEIANFLHNAIEAIRICTPEGKIFEYETETLFYDTFKKYAKVYYDAITKCDPSIRLDINASSIKQDESCNVYLMHDLANDYYKIGISNNPGYRERTLQSEKPTIELVIAKEFPVRRIAEAFEAALHKTYEAKRLRGEWFRLDSKDVENLIKALS